MQERLWLYRTKPQEDELFSSWLVRLAHGLAVKLQTLCVQMLNLPRGFWAGDVDRGPSQSVLERLAVVTAVPVDRSSKTGLSAYEGFLWERYCPRGQLQWVMPVGRVGRRRRDHGQQFCRRCLVNDERPYFRRKWRLAFSVACERHGILLDDACRSCGAAVEFHAGDFGRRLLDLECPITRCPRCGDDWRSTRSHDDNMASDDILNFQSRLNAVLLDGYSLLLPGGQNYGSLFFAGLRCLVRNLVSNGRSDRIRQFMRAQDSQLALGVAAVRRRPNFEELRIGDRTEILGWCWHLLQDWPLNFVGVCRQSRVSSSYILRSQTTTPYWFAAPVAWYLNDQDYAPAEGEIIAAREYLSRRGLSATTNAIRRALGVSHNPGRGHLQGIESARWNRRGPRAR